MRGVGASDRPITCGEPGGAENGKTSCQGLIVLGRCITKAGEGGGGPMEGAKTSFDGVGARDRLTVCGELGGAEKQKPSRRGSVFPGRCVTKVGEDGERSHRGG